MKKIALVILLFSAVNVSAAAEFMGHVTNFYVNSSGTVLFKTENSDGQSSASCPTGLWPFRFSLSATPSKEWISMLLTAKATNEKIKVGYSVAENGSCIVSYLYFKG